MIRYSAVIVTAGVLLAACSAAPSVTFDVDTREPFVFDTDFADPDILEVDGMYYGYATQGNGVNIQTATSADLHDWTLLPSDALPAVPDWSTPGDTWAPDVSQIDGRFVMYLATTESSTGRQCIGTAVSSTPEGPFVPLDDEPMVCPQDEGGAIDPASFVDGDGTRYLLFKNDGNCCGLDTWISIVPLSEDGLTLSGEPTRLIKQDQDWEGNLIEAPTLIEHEGQYVLFYSANDYNSLDYAMGYATSDAVLGPYGKATAPLLSTESSDFAFYGPGGQDVVGDVLIFHSWNEDHTHRGLNIAPLDWSGSTPTVVLPRPVD